MRYSLETKCAIAATAIVWLAFLVTLATIDFRWIIALGLWHVLQDCRGAVKERYKADKEAAKQHDTPGTI